MRNEEPHIIEVTNDVINRLRSGAQPAPTLLGTIEQPTKPLPPPPQAQQVPVGESGQTLGPAVGTVPIPKDPLALSVNTSGQQIFETVSAIQVRQEKDEELRQNDFIWRSKLKELEARYVSSAFASDQEFNTELDKLEKLVPKKREPICRDLSLKVSECYATHPNQSLKCSEVVQEFSRCVETFTSQSL